MKGVSSTVIVWHVLEFFNFEIVEILQRKLKKYFEKFILWFGCSTKQEELTYGYFSQLYYHYTKRRFLLKPFFPQTDLPLTKGASR